MNSKAVLIPIISLFITIPLLAEEVLFRCNTSYQGKLVPTQVVINKDYNSVNLRVNDPNFSEKIYGWVPYDQGTVVENNANTFYLHKKRGTLPAPRRYQIIQIDRESGKGRFKYYESFSGGQINRKFSLNSCVAVDEKLEAIKDNIYKNPYTYTPSLDQPSDVLTAALRSDEKKLKTLLNQGIDPNFQDFRSQSHPGWSAIHVGAWYGNYQITNALLAVGAKTDLQNRKGTTPLHYAADNRRVQLVKDLLNAGANVHLTNNLQQTPLFVADYHEVVDLLLAAGANPNRISQGEVSYAFDTFDNLEMTPLMKVTDNCRKDLIKALLRSSSIEVNLQNQNGRTALHFAAAYGCREGIIDLLAAGADKSSLDKFGKLPIDYAKYESIKTLLK